MGKVKDKLGKWVIKHEKWHCIFRCFHNIGDLFFVRDVNNESLSILKIQSNGDWHKGKILYKITRDAAGFCANFLAVLGDMWYADSMGMYPVVVWGEGCAYYEKNGVNGCFNVWEYYFKQYADYHVEDLESAYRISNVNKNISRMIFGIENDYTVTEEYILELGRIMKKYIRLRPDIENYIREKIRELIGEKRTLGVHIRMGSMLKHYNNHPIVPTLDEYIEQTKKIYEKGYEQIFLATDDNRALERMKIKFGNSLVYFIDITRVDSECSTYCVHIKEELNNYKCGLDVLLDMYTLANCDGLVAGLSKVSMASQIAKIASGKRYKDIFVIDKGLNHNYRNAPDITKELYK